MTQQPSGESERKTCPTCKTYTWIYEEDSYYTCLYCERKKLEKRLAVARKALERCSKFDTSGVPGYGKGIRGQIPPVGARFLRPRDYAEEALAEIDKEA